MQPQAQVVGHTCRCVPQRCIEDEILSNPVPVLFHSRCDSRSKFRGFNSSPADAIAMDLALDTSGFSCIWRNAGLRDRVRIKILSMRARLALPNQALSELADSDKADGVTSRMACVAELADAMNGRFFITMDLKDHLDEEYERAITSIMRIPPDDSTKIMEIFRAPNTFLSHFDELKQRIRSQQKKEWT